MFNIVLVEPEIPQNTGNISRTCACTGAALHLVRPFGFEISDRTLKRAGLDYWDKLSVFYYDDFSELYEKHGKNEFFFFTKFAEKNYAKVRYPENCFLVFGKETKGLSKDITGRFPERLVRIPMTENLRCLNLSNSAAVAVYEALRQNGFKGLV